MPKDRWAVHLCSCNGALPIDTKEIARLAELDGEPAAHSNLGRAGTGAFWNGARIGADYHLVCCCCPDESFVPVFREAGVEEGQIVHLDIKGRAFQGQESREEGNRLAARLIRSAIARTEAERMVPPISLEVPSTVLIYTDTPLGLRLAERLAGRMQVHVVMDEDAEGFDDLTPIRPYGSLIRGKIVRVNGRLGAFHSSLRTRQAIDLDTCIRCGRCVPVCHAKAITPGLRLIASKCDECGDCLKECAEVGAIRIPRHDVREISTGQVVSLLAGAPPPESARHTGYHVVVADEALDVDAVAFRVSGLVGEFARPSYVAYEEKICAGSSAEIEGCGICLGECPFEAIGRSENRILIDGSVCEGCGGCVSACPTSALRFHEPSLEQIDAQLQALLSNPPGEEGKRGRNGVVFYCGEKGKETIGVAAENRWPIGTNFLPIEVPCLRYVSEALILRCFRLGAAGVGLLGCGDCPNGERPLLEERLSFCRSILDAFGFGAERLSSILVESSDQTYYMASAVGELGAFLERLEPAPILNVSATQIAAISDGSDNPIGNRTMVIDSLRTFVRVTDKHPGRVVGVTSLPYAHVRVQEKGCTLCAGCVFVCPTHALIMEEPSSAMTETRTLRFNHLKCVACGMCETACPENVLSIERGLSVSRSSLSFEEVVRDEMVHCVSCGREFINKQALDAILGKLIGLAQIGDTFEGQRKNLLRMCPDCRGAQAVQEVERGWDP